MRLAGLGCAKESWERRVNYHKVREGVKWRRQKRERWRREEDEQKIEWRKSGEEKRVEKRVRGEKKERSLKIKRKREKSEEAENAETDNVGGEISPESGRCANDTVEREIWEWEIEMKKVGEKGEEKIIGNWERTREKNEEEG